MTLEATMNFHINFTPPFVKASTASVINSLTTSTSPTSTTTTLQSFLNQWHTVEFSAAEWACKVTLGSLVHVDLELRNSFTAAKCDLKKAWERRYLDTDSYQRFVTLLKDYSSGAEDFTLDATYLLTLRTMKEFEKNGIHLPPPTRNRIHQLREKIAEDEAKFQQNLGEDKTVLEYSEDELRGCTKTFIDGLPCNPTSGNKILVLKPNTLLSLLSTCSIPSTRKSHYLASKNKCGNENAPLLFQLLKNRNECAKLLGFKTWAEYRLSLNMASTPTAATTLLTTLNEKIARRSLSDVTRLLEIKRCEEGGKNANSLDPWDVAYCENQLKTQLHIDDEEIKRYFPVEWVISRTLAIYEKLFDLKFEPMLAHSHNFWHPSVKLFGVYENGNCIGHFFLDLFSREGKYGHQCVVPLRPSYLDPITQQQITPIAANIGNLSASSEDGVALLRHSEVVTFFHEFGHIVHCLSTKVPVTLYSWTWSALPFPGGVEVDFLEVPSQMLENWVWHGEVLKLLSCHRDDLVVSSTLSSSLRPLPDALIEKLSSSRYLLSGIKYQTMVFMMAFDLHVHSIDFDDPANTIQDVDHVWHSMFKEYLPTYYHDPTTPLLGTRPTANWYHIAMGYDACYYSYLWSLVISCDFWSVMKNSVLDARMGKVYREKVLKPGASLSGQRMVEDFLQRPSSAHSFFQQLGLND